MRYIYNTHGRTVKGTRIRGFGFFPSLVLLVIMLSRSGRVSRSARRADTTEKIAAGPKGEELCYYHVCDGT